MRFPTQAQIKQSFKDLFFSPPEDYKLDRGEAEKICHIADPTNISQSEAQYFECAQRLRREAQYSEARTILFSLVDHSQNQKIADQAAVVLGEMISNPRHNFFNKFAQSSARFFYTRYVDPHHPNEYSEPLLSSEDDTANGMIGMGIVGVGLMYTGLGLALVGLPFMYLGVRHSANSYLDGHPVDDKFNHLSN